MKLCISITQGEDGQYSAECISLPGCIGRGATREQARQRLEEAIRNYVAAMGSMHGDEFNQELIDIGAA